MRKNIFVPLALLFLVNHSFLSSQSQPTRQADNHVAIANQMNDLFNIAASKSQTLDYSSIEGSPYLSDTYQKGTLTNQQGEKLGEYSLRYNAFSDRMEIPQPNGDIGSLKKVEFLTIELENKRYSTINYTNQNGKTDKGYFIELVVDSTCSLYEKKVRRLQEAKEAKSTFHPPTPARFLDDTHYYLKFEGNGLKKIKLNKKKVLNTFPNHVDELKRFAKKEKLNLSTEPDFIKLVTYYNSL